eukprot:GEMP01037012.1.p1 GENE.GEMP01037012.1~~GEMP01037012.1.p1  ORF type:complete len:433 (+),score=64.06 GEMP01037012.1:384-1682(+)
MGAVNDRVDQMVRYANEILEDQFDIRLRVEEFLVASPEQSTSGSAQYRWKDDASSKWIYDVPDDKDEGRCNCCGRDRLLLFKNWIDNRFGAQYALWHLLSICRGESKSADEDGKIKWKLDGGSAYRSGVCGEYSYGRTVFTVNSDYSDNILIHEIGHNLGARHTFLPAKKWGLGFDLKSGNGIMDYFNKTTGFELNGIVQFHHGHGTNVCHTLTWVVKSQQDRNCLVTGGGANTGGTAGKMDTDRPAKKASTTATTTMTPTTTTTTMGPSTHGALKDISAFCPNYATKDTCAIQESRQSIMCRETCARLLGGDGGKKMRRGTPGVKTPTGGSNCLDERSAAECAAWEPACKTDVTVQRLCRKTCGMCGGANARSAQTQEDGSRSTALLTAGILVGVALVVVVVPVVAWINFRRKIRPRTPLDANTGNRFRHE